MKLFRRREPKSTFLIVGLGNPGQKYRGNRHNIGEMAVNRLAEHWGGALTKKQARSLTMTHHLENSNVILAKPKTFMNESGRAVSALLQFYKIPLERLLVIYDELDLPLGTLRIRPEGGTGGHRGMRSIQHSLQSQNYPRMRLGIGRPPGRMDPAHYVLQNFSQEEMYLVDQVLDQAMKCLELFITQGVEAAMNHCNNVVIDE